MRLYTVAIVTNKQNSFYRNFTTFYIYKMGKWFSRQSRQPQPSAEPAKKVYSWDRADRPDPKDYMYSDLEGAVVGKCPGSINGQQFLIQNCKDCAIYLFDHSAAVTVDDCVSCQIFVGPVKGSIFLRDCKQCRVMVACQQFRSRDCSKMDILLHCSSQPVIESCTKMKFGCFTASYPQLEGQFKSAGISLVSNNWSDIHDFTPASGEINWSLLDHREFDIPSNNAELLEVGLSIKVDKSVTPVTVGVAQRPQGQSCLLVFLGQDHVINVSQAIQVLRQANKKGLTTVQIQELTLPKQAASDLFSPNEKLVQKATARAKLVGTEIVHDDDCKAVVMEIISEVCPSAMEMGDIFISCDPDKTSRDVELFFNAAQQNLTL